MAFSLQVALLLLAVAALAHPSEHQSSIWGAEDVLDNSGSDYWEFWEDSQSGPEDDYWGYWDSPTHDTEVVTWGPGVPTVVQSTSRPPHYMVNNDPSRNVILEIEDQGHGGGGGTQYVEGVGVKGVSNRGGAQYIRRTDVQGVYNYGNQQYVRGTGGNIALGI